MCARKNGHQSSPFNTFRFCSVHSRNQTNNHDIELCSKLACCSSLPPGLASLLNNSGMSETGTPTPICIFSCPPHCSWLLRLPQPQRSLWLHCGSSESYRKLNHIVSPSLCRHWPSCQSQPVRLGMLLCSGMISKIDALDSLARLLVAFLVSHPLQPKGAESTNSTAKESQVNINQMRRYILYCEPQQAQNGQGICKSLSKHTHIYIYNIYS